MSLLTGEIVSVVAYPYVFQHLLYSERGVQVQENLVNNDWNYYKNFFLEYMYTINYCVFFSRFSTILICFIGCSFIAWIGSALVKRNYLGKIPFIACEKNQRALMEKNGVYNLMLVVIATVAYFLILYKISYTSRWLYISPIFPLLGIVAVTFFVIVINKIYIKKYGIILLTISCLFLCPKIGDTIKWAISENANTRKLHEEIVSYSGNCDVLFFYDEWNNLYDNQILELMEFDQIRAIAEEEIEIIDYDEILSDRKDSDNLMLYVSTKIDDYESKLEHVINEIRPQKYSLIREGKHLIYFIEL